MLLLLDRCKHIDYTCFFRNATQTASIDTKTLSLLRDHMEVNLDASGGSLGIDATLKPIFQVLATMTQEPDTRKISSGSLIGIMKLLMVQVAGKAFRSGH